MEADMLNKRFILIMLVIGLVLGTFAVSIASEQVKFNGRLMQVSGIWFVKTADDIYGLDIASLTEQYGQSLELVISSDAEVTGDMTDFVINVATLKSGDSFFEIKNDEPAAKEEHTGYKVDAKRCISCRLCVGNCPVGAIEMVNGKAVIDADKCIQCGICKNGNGQGWNGCPVGAIDN